MESSEEQTNQKKPMTKVRHYNSEPNTLSLSCSDELTVSERTLSTNSASPRLSYSQSFRSIKEQKVHKNIVADSPYNNAAILDSLFGKVDLKKQLQEILSTFELCFLFRQFLEQQRCVENLDFYVEVELLKKEKYKDSELDCKVSKIVSKYFSGDVELNIDSDVKEELQTRFQKKEYSKDMFDFAQISILRLLETSSTERFIRSSCYKTYKDNLHSRKKQTKRTFTNSKSSTYSKFSKVYSNASEENLNLHQLFHILEMEKEEENAIESKEKENRKPGRSLFKFFTLHRSWSLRNVKSQK